MGAVRHTAEVTMKKQISSWIRAAGVAIVFSGMLAPADAQEPFYKGKTIRLIVGLSAGGGYDVYSRPELVEKLKEILK
jgi:tripartite-type tricarboxylate transporter receptor subunit TctC